MAKVRKAVKKPAGKARRTTARKKTANLHAAVPKGKKRKAEVKRQELVQSKRQKQKETKERFKTTTLKALVSVAREINVRLEKAAKMDHQADDHRLAAAIKLEEARRRCMEAKIKFRDWVDENVTQSYEEVRKLVSVGAAPDPVKALADMRAGAAARMKKHRERQKQQALASRDAKMKPRPLTPYEVATEALKQMPEKDILELARNRVAPLGMRVVSDDDAKKLRQLREKKAEPVTVKQMQTQFLTLKASDKLAFVRWAANELGVTVEGDYQDNIENIPESLRVHP